VPALNVKIPPELVPEAHKETPLEATAEWRENTSVAATAHRRPPHRDHEDKSIPQFLSDRFHDLTLGVRDPLVAPDAIPHRHSEALKDPIICAIVAASPKAMREQLAKSLFQREFQAILESPQAEIPPHSPNPLG